MDHPALRDGVSVRARMLDTEFQCMRELHKTYDEWILLERDLREAHVAHMIGRGMAEKIRLWKQRKQKN